MPSIALGCLLFAVHGGESDPAPQVEMSIPPAVEAAIEKGLGFLARTQQDDGSWLSHFGRTTAIVGSCGLAFLANGHLPGRGRYAANVERALGFLVRNARPDGLLYQEGMPGSPMYHHGIAMVALAEAWGMAPRSDARVYEVLARAVDLTVRCQNLRGGWRYQPVRADDDLSVTVVQLLGLRAARDVGVYVPSQTIEAGLRYVRSAWNERHAGFSYQPGGEGSWGGGFNMTAAGVLSLQLAGEYDAPEVAAGLRSALTQYFQNNRGDDHFFYYGRYYLAQCVYQAQSKMPWGIRAWNTFYPAMAEELLHRQMASGCWHDLNDEYGTAQSLLILAIPKRLLPIYQR